MPLAMLHLRSLYESMLKAARPLEHLIWRALTNLFSALSAGLAKSFKATSTVLSQATPTPVHSIRMSIKEHFFLGKWILIDQVRGPLLEYLRKFWTVLRNFPRTMTGIHEHLSWSWHFPWVL